MNAALNRPSPHGDAPPARPRFLPLAEEARRRGMSTEALRRWCERRGVPIRQANHRDAWVESAAVDAAVERLPVACASRRVPDEIDAAVSLVPGVKL